MTNMTKWKEYEPNEILYGAYAITHLQRKINGVYVNAVEYTLSNGNTIWEIDFQLDDYFNDDKAVNIKIFSYEEKDLKLFYKEANKIIKKTI